MVFRKRPIYLWLTIILGTPLVILLIWISFNGLYHTSVPNEIFTRSDMPASPSQKVNGWRKIFDEFRKNPEAFSGLIDDYLFRLMDDVDQVTARGPLNLAERRHLCDMVSVGGKEVDIVRKSVPYRLYLEGMKKRFFRDDSSPKEGILEKTPTLDIFYLHKLEMIHVADLVCRKDYGQAAQNLSQLIRTDNDFVLSSPILPQLLGLIMLRTDLQMATLILEDVTQGAGEKQVALPPELLPLRTAIENIDLTNVNPKNIVASEYLSILSLLHMVENRMIGTGDVVEGIGQMLGSRHATFKILYDRGSTLRLLNDFYVDFDAAAEDPANIQMASESYKERFEGDFDRKSPLFWSYNPLGKIMLSVMMIDLSEQIARYAFEREAIERVSGRLKDQMNPKIQ